MSISTVMHSPIIIDVIKENNYPMVKIEKTEDLDQFAGSIVVCKINALSLTSIMRTYCTTTRIGFMTEGVSEISKKPNSHIIKDFNVNVEASTDLEDYLSEKYKPWNTSVYIRKATTEEVNQLYKDINDDCIKHHKLEVNKVKELAKEYLANLMFILGQYDNKSLIHSFPREIVVLIVNADDSERLKAKIQTALCKPIQSSNSQNKELQPHFEFDMHNGLDLGCQKSWPSPLKH